MSAPWWIEMRAEQLVLELREILVRYDENIKAFALLQDAVPYFLEDADRHPQIASARADQAAMIDHIIGESYSDYYATNHHERCFEEQYQCHPEQAHERLHRVRFLRTWLEAQDQRPLALLDVACNDGWMARNLDGLVTYHGLDLNPHCLERARGRKVAGARFERAFAEDAEAETYPLRPAPGYDVAVAYELVEHVKDPHAVLSAMVACVRPGGSLFVSTPLGAGTGGDLPRWFFVEPKGHVRAFTPHSFLELLAPHGHIDEARFSASDTVAGAAVLLCEGREVGELQVSDTAAAGQLMVARVQVPGVG